MKMKTFQFNISNEYFGGEADTSRILFNHVKSIQVSESQVDFKRT